jgi:hypothetical protein
VVLSLPSRQPEASMKRPTLALRQRLIKAALRERWKRETREGEGTDFGESVRRQNAEFPKEARVPYPTNIVYVALEGKVNFLQKPRKAFRTLRQIPEPSSTEWVGPTRLIASMKDLREIDPVGLLFLCSRLHQIAIKPMRLVAGTYPDPSPALQALHDADFHGFVSGELPAIARITLNTSPVLTLRRSIDEQDRRVRPQTAKDIRDFLIARVPTFSVMERDLLFSAVAELLENIRSHAYKFDASRRKGWYIVGLHDEKSRVSTVVVLDVGVGILQSIRLRARITGDKLPTDDGVLLGEATSGKRTESGDPHRGQGLKWIRSRFAEAEKGRWLHVLCNSRMVTFSHGNGPRLRSIPAFDGTIVAIQIQTP